MTLPFDPARLEAFLHEEGLCDGAVTLTRIGDGHSNLTYLVEDGTRAVVVRRPPPPPTPPGANNVVREARFQQALAGTGVPLARILAVREESDVIEAPFYVMERVDGIVATTQTPPALDEPGHRRAIGEALIDALVALHAVDVDAVAAITRPRRSRGAAERLDLFTRLLGDEVPAAIAELLGDLTQDVPRSEEQCIVHGDFRLGNVMLATEPPARILAVLDWELAGVGDPLDDLGYLLATYAQADEPLHALTAMSAATRAAGYPARADLAARYAEATGRDVSAIRWYVAAALWKLAVLFEYQRRRVADGIGDEYYNDPALVPGLLAAARPLMERART